MDISLYGESIVFAFLQWTKISKSFTANSFTSFTSTALSISFPNACVHVSGIITNYGQTLRDCLIALTHSLTHAQGVAVNGYTGAQTLSADVLYIGF